MRWLAVIAFIVVYLFPIKLAAADQVVTTQNVQVSLGPAHARHDIRQAARGSQLLALQEMHYRSATRYRPPGWGSAQARPGRPVEARDCAVMWQRHSWAVVSHRAIQLSHRGLSGLGHDRWALLVLLRHHGAPLTAAVLCVHLSTWRYPQLRAVQLRAVHQVGASLVRWVPSPRLLVIAGDWNVTRPAVARVLHQRPAFISSGGRRVDSVWWRPAWHIQRATILGGTYSDHDGVRARLVQ